MEWIFVLGVVTGCRAMTAIAVVCWAAWLHILPEHGWAMWVTYLMSALVFTGLALGEYVGDTLQSTPSRKSAFPALSRVAFGAVVGAVVATSIYEPIAGGVLAGVLGALAGTWGGYAVRASLAQRVGHDLPVALAESAVSVLLAVLAVAKLHHGVVLDMKRGAV